MVGHKWHPAEGTIVSTEQQQMSGLTQPGMQWVNVHDIDLRRPDGQLSRVKVVDPDNDHLHPGTVVLLEIHSKTGEIRMSPHRDQRIIRHTFGPQSEDGFNPPPASLLPQVTVTGVGGTDLGQLFGGTASVVVGGGTTPSDRLAMLQQLLVRGQLTQAEFDTKRREIIDSL
jgi:hypothetical protein